MTLEEWLHANDLYWPAWARCAMRSKRSAAAAPDETRRLAGSLGRSSA